MEQDIYALIHKAQQGDQSSLNKLVSNNLNLVRSVAARFGSFPYERDDLFQIGCIGLVKAIQRFDTSFEVRFSTYAVPLIIGEIKRFIRDDNAVKISRDLKRTGIKIRQKSDELCSQLGREPTIGEIAAALDIAPQEAAAALEAARPLKSLYEPLVNQNGDVSLLIDNIADSGGAKVFDHVALEEAMQCLSQSEREVIRQRFFADKTQSETAKVICVSQVQVSRLEKRALGKLKTFFSV